MQNNRFHIQVVCELSLRFWSSRTFNQMSEFAHGWGVVRETVRIPGGHPLPEFRAYFGLVGIVEVRVSDFCLRGIHLSSRNLPNAFRHVRHGLSLQSRYF